MKFVLGVAGYAVLTFAAMGCQQKKSAPAPVNEPVISATTIPNTTATTQSNSVSGYIMRKSVVAPGDECRYGGTRAEGGMDKDSSGVLDSSEVTSSFVVCDGTIEQIGKETFKKYAHSIGLVITKSSALLSGGTTSGGTGWIVGDGLVVTNGHVAESQGGLLQTGYEIWVYFPKTLYAAETILAKGLPNYAGFAPSEKDFDAYKATAVDLSPYNSKSGDSADLAFLTVPGISGRAVLPLQTATLSSTAGSPADLADNGARDSVNLGDGIFNINYSQVQGPRLSMGTVTTIQTCAAWLKTADASCISELRIPDSRRLLFWWGYGDHGGSGSPVFDRFGKVTAIFTFGSVPPDTFTAAGQFVGDLTYWLSKPRAWATLK